MGGAIASTTYAQLVKNSDSDFNIAEALINNVPSGQVKSFLSRGGNRDRLSYTNGFWQNTTAEIAIIDFHATTFSASSRFVLFGAV